MVKNKPYDSQKSMRDEKLNMLTCYTYIGENNEILNFKNYAIRIYNNVILVNFKNLGYRQPAFENLQPLS